MARRYGLHRAQPARDAVLLAALIALVISGCGGGHTAAAHPAPSSAAHRPAPELLFMRRLQPNTMLFENVAIRTDGTGESGTLIGEISGVHYVPFRLTPRQLALIRRLSVAVGRGHYQPFPSGALGPVHYTIRADGQTVEVVQGHIPGRLARLVDLLNGLMNRYD